MTIILNRRAFLATTLASQLAPAAKLFAAPATDARLLVVFLRGAYDSLSVLVPNSPFYVEARPSLAILCSGKGAADALDGDWGLGPAVAPSLLPFWKARQLAFIPFAGTTDLTRSHFHAQDTLERGLASIPRGAPSGFLGRLAPEIGGVRPLSFTGQLPLIFRGPMPVPNIVVAENVGRVNERRNDQLTRMYAGDKELGAQVALDITSRLEISRALANEMANSGKNAVDAGGFEGTAQRIGQAMRGRTNLGFVDIGGWDTHVNQSGGLNYKLGVLSSGLASFAEALGPQAWDKTVVVVMSEFGRTIRENGGRGTDHGRGTAFWVLGGAIGGGRVFGRQVTVSRDKLNEDRDLPVLNDSRAVLAGLFQRLYGLSSTAVARVFPGVQPLQTGLL